MDKRTFVAVVACAAIAMAAQACVNIDLGDPDPRMGEEGKVRFDGGGGCSNSTILAVGSTAELTLEPQEGITLPADLEIESSAPAVIGATLGTSADEVVLVAHEAGDARVDLLSGGDVWDWLEFDATPAVSAEFDAPDRLFAGDTLWISMTEIYGDCDEECPLIGGGFLSWGSDPAGSVTFDVEESRQALFGTDGSATGSVAVTGTEPAEGNVVLTHSVVLVPPADAGDLGVEVVVMLPDETLLDPQPLPTEILVGSLCQFRFSAPAGGEDVPLSRFAVVLDVSGDAGVLEAYALGDGEAPEGAIFEVTGPGTASISATAALIGKSVIVEIVAVD